MFSTPPFRPLETADENVTRLTAGKTTSLGYPEFCPTRETANNHVMCPHCGIQYCSENCRIDAAQRYHEELCLRGRHADPDHPINVLVETWK